MPLKRVAQSPANYWGVYDMHGLIWEWTQDFNSNLVSGESRADSTLNQTMFCGSGAAGAPDPSDYAAFMRYGFRSSLQSQFALKAWDFAVQRLKSATLRQTTSKIAQNEPIGYNQLTSELTITT